MATSGERGQLLRRGRFQWRQPRDHRCEPPVRLTDSGHRSGDATEPVGSVWRCDVCGRRYKAVNRDGEYGTTWTAWRRLLLPHFNRYSSKIGGGNAG